MIFTISAPGETVEKVTSYAARLGVSRSFLCTRLIEHGCGLLETGEPLKRGDPMVLSKEGEAT